MLHLLGMQELVFVLLRLMKDQEADVRSCAAGKLSAFAAKLGQAERETLIMTNLLPQVAELCSDR